MTPQQGYSVKPTFKTKHTCSDLLGVGYLAAAALVVCACNDRQRQVTPGSAPELMGIGRMHATMGFFAGRHRERLQVGPFRITRFPITVAHYRECVDLAHCHAPSPQCGSAAGLLDRSTYHGLGAETVPVTCATPAQAATFCAWTGGRLPTASEWLVAARGTAPRRYPWVGNDTACRKHPVANGMLAAALSCCQGSEGCSANTLATVGTHPDGRSPFGVEDLLVSTGELVVRDGRSTLTDCGHNSLGCVIVGSAGSIRNLVAWQPDSSMSTTFRCVYDETEVDQ